MREGKRRKMKDFESFSSFINDRTVLAERRVDNQVKIGLLVRHLDPGPNGYYLTNGHNILAGPMRRTDLMVWTK
jgi:hypothetical protein